MLTYCVSPPRDGSSTANSVVALGGRGWLEWSVWKVSPGMMRLPFTMIVVGDVIDVGVAGDVLLFLVVKLQLTEQLRRSLELLRVEVLVAHDQDVMLGEGAIERGAGFAHRSAG